MGSFWIINLEAWNTWTSRQKKNVPLSSKRQKYTRGWTNFKISLKCINQNCKEAQCPLPSKAWIFRQQVLILVMSDLRNLKITYEKKRPLLAVGSVKLK